MSDASERSCADVSSEELREHQSNERTYLAWVRTGLALMGFGFVVARFGFIAGAIPNVVMNAGAPVRGAQGTMWFGTALVALAVLVFISSTARFAQVRRAIASRRRGRPRTGVLYAVGVSAALIAFGLAVLLVFAFG